MLLVQPPIRGGGQTSGSVTAKLNKCISDLATLTNKINTINNSNNMIYFNSELYKSWLMTNIETVAIPCNKNSSISTSYKTILNISGEGYIHELYFPSNTVQTSNGYIPITLKIIVDGTTYYFSADKNSTYWVNNGGISFGIYGYYDNRNKISSISSNEGDVYRIGATPTVFKFNNSLMIQYKFSSSGTQINNNTNINCCRYSLV